MLLPNHKTKIVATIGPSSKAPEMLERMIAGGMNVARLNFSHGDFESHERMIRNIRAASKATGIRVAIMGDLPGPKIRIGQIREEPVFLRAGDALVLSVDSTAEHDERVFVSFPMLPFVVHAGDTLFLNDGLIELQVQGVKDLDVYCTVVVGGELRSRKGLNLPGINLGISAFTDTDRAWLKFAVMQGVDAVSQSFVDCAADILAVRAAAEPLGRVPFIIAKIERATAVENYEAILDVADGIMVARGDLGVETPIEEIAVLQKKLIKAARQRGKPVITATQMLESMTANRRPTRAESTDVANAILDGADCVMLSGESANGLYPAESVAMLAKIAAAVEPHVRVERSPSEPGETIPTSVGDIRELIAMSVRTAVKRAHPAAVLVPTRTGTSARSISRYRLPVWIVSVSPQEATCRHLAFSYGVYPVHSEEDPEDWKAYAESLVSERHLTGDVVILTQGPSRKHPETNHRMEVIDIRA